MRLVSRLAAAAAAVSLALAAAPAAAEPTVGQWRANRDDPQMTAFLLGFASGTGWANTDLEAEGRARVFCQPKQLSLTYDLLKQILEAFLVANPGIEDDMMVTGVLLFALKDRYPCPAGTPA